MKQTHRHPKWSAMMLALLASVLVASRAQGQILSGEWVKESDRNIEENHKTRLRVLVLNAQGRPAALTMVKVTQLTHAFTWGIDAPAVPEARPLPVVWRCFNAVSLDPAGTLSCTRPTAEPMDTTAIDRTLASFPEDWTVRWGGVVSGDWTDAPEWIARLKGDELDTALSDHTTALLRRYAGRADGFDVYTHVRESGFIESRLGEGAIRSLFERAKAARPTATIGIRFDDVFEGPRLPGMIQRVRTLREAFVPFDSIAVSGRFGGTLVQATLREAVEWIGRLDMPVTVSGLEVGGASPAAAALNLEMVLRTFFAAPSIHAIYFTGVTRQQVTDPSAAFLDDAGQPTPTGELLDRMLHTLWWTDTELRTDAMGNARAKVFAGRYRITAMFGDGSASSVDVWLPVSGGERTVVIEPIKPDKPQDDPR
ncbi:MAG: endo-1,4-beta-xylanase [Planctomycetes bacterium]|nr:endo-1,4-beta-xylanase [Planctomycetota bacterium]